MGIHRGPNTVKDGLVFGYDTGYGVADNSTATRFYPGKAVDNEFYNSGPNGTILDYVGYGGTGTAQSGALDALGTTDNIVYRKTGKLRFGPTGGDDIGTLYYGNTYTFSIYMRHVPGETQMSGGEFDINDRTGSRNYSGTLSSNMTYEWKRFSVTALHNNSSNYHFIDVGVYQGTGVFEWCCPQIELGTIASPFTSTERSDTASLIDLKRTTNIDVSNVSFDSTGQPTFDGTNDVITTSFPATTIPNVTIEAVVYRNQATTRYEAIVQNNNASDDALYVNPSGFLIFWPCSTSSLAVPTGQWSHVAVSYNGTTLTYIVNGTTQVVTATCTDITDWDFLRIGGHGTTDGERWIGKIAVAKVYEKSLSAGELIQNYNAYKNRFDI